MSLAPVATETIEITRRGWYTAPTGERVDLAELIEGAMTGTRLYGPNDYGQLGRPATACTSTVVEVTDETTAAAGRRLVAKEGHARVAALNFASAKNPGGGFLSGAKAQEEDLARCSALYACQLQKRAYYDANRASGSLLYTDHIIYSPDVPFFRDDGLRLLAAPFLLSLITAPAPNAGEAERRGEGHLVRATLERRAHRVLAVSAHHRHEVLVLGAWGCGVFRNDPRAVADVFAQLLASLPFSSAFRRVVFAIYDRSKTQSTLRAFREQFAERAP
jgi:uncharacterized protein (TIGR02452 family)